MRLDDVEELRDSDSVLCEHISIESKSGSCFKMNLKVRVFPYLQSSVYNLDNLNPSA